MGKSLTWEDYWSQFTANGLRARAVRRVEFEVKGWRRKMEHQGISTRQLAEVLGWSHMKVHRLISQQVEPSMSDGIMMAIALDENTWIT